ncbi:DUF4232 domain-containing protein [Streptomyces sp. NPDC006356]
MSDFRTSRTSRTRLVAAAATAVLATLSLSACNDGTGTKDEGAATTTAPTGSASVTPSGGSGGNSSSDTSGSSGGGAGGADSGSTAQTPATKAPDSSSKPVTCEGSNTKTVAAPLNRPVNHMLLTVTNTGSKACFLYGYPAVAFGEAQSVPPVIEESQPQAVVTLEPGQSGYASVSLSATDGSASGGRTEKSLAVSFYGRSMSGSVGRAAHPSLPAEGVHIDDSLKVTYWQQSMDDATSW